ncbi:hypothetical protein EV207_15620 [Scopulibacillus darangshiensis]|uniref:YtkA-like protein n=1 Tax=Scopulibacillus darangshiensis TaxID=442528 RepID=A0A4R2NFW3_9BACL|nr:hypothetical protein [Scopulibacillus darangshiensis]TCP19984.1 hypothetical protein EV207_15620 [Scopulibacillus darangshiensis]
MNKRTIFRVIIMLVMILIMLDSETAAKAKEGKTGLMITSLINQDGLVSGKEIPFTVHVVKVDENHPKASMKNEDGAIVYVYFKKDDKVIKRKLTDGKDGEYKGKVKLPESGDWQVVAMALKSDRQQNGQPEMLKTEWKVEEPNGLSSAWITSFVFVILAAGYFVVRKRKQRSKSI